LRSETACKLGFICFLARDCMPARTFGRRSLKTGEVTSWNAALYLASDKMFPVWQEGPVYGQLSLPASSSSLRGEIEVAAGGLWIGVGQACGLLAAGRSRLWRSFQGAGKNFSKHRRLCAQQRKKHPDRKRETRNGRRSPWGLIGKVAMEEIVPRSPSCFVSFGLHDLGLEDNVTTYGSVAEGLEFHTRQRQWEPQIAAGRTADEAAITWSTNC
jgi:hypothetical protein